MMIVSVERLEDLVGSVGVDGGGEAEFRFELRDGGLERGDGMIGGEAVRLERVDALGYLVQLRGQRELRIGLIWM